MRPNRKPEKQHHQNGDDALGSGGSRQRDLASRQNSSTHKKTAVPIRKRRSSVYRTLIFGNEAASPTGQRFAIVSTTKVVGQDILGLNAQVGQHTLYGVDHHWRTTKVVLTILRRRV